MSAYDLENVVAAYAADLLESLPAALTIDGSPDVDSVAVNLACGGLRVDVYGTIGRGVVVASFGDEMAVCRVPVDTWAAAWEMLVELSPRPF